MLDPDPFAGLDPGDDQVAADALYSGQRIELLQHKVLQVLVHLQHGVDVELAGAGHQVHVGDRLFGDQRISHLVERGGRYLDVKEYGDVPSHLLRIQDDGVLFDDAALFQCVDPVFDRNTGEPHLL